MGSIDVVAAARPLHKYIQCKSLTGGDGGEPWLLPRLLRAAFAVLTEVFERIRTARGSPAAHRSSPSCTPCTPALHALCTVLVSL